MKTNTRWNPHAPAKLMLNVQGEKREVVVPHTPEDIDNQPEINAWGLALIALSPYDERGIMRWSPYARETLIRLSNEYGDEVVRRQLRGLIIDMNGGFKPTNPIGLLIHRVRQSGTTKEIML